MAAGCHIRLGGRCDFPRVAELHADDRLSVSLELGWYAYNNLCALVIIVQRGVNIIALQPTILNGIQ